MESLGEADPASVGGYPLFARLGAGGMGQVYLARSPAGRPLALKTVRPEFGADPAFGERFAREIRHADRVRSPWTVTVVDFSQPGAHPQWLATEYVAAPPLDGWVREHGPLPPAGLTALAAELCEALHAVHQAGLAHRDVKPSNILLSGARPLLIDFGIARAAEDSRHTRTGGIIGSPGYMAPEQATQGVSAERGDVFALGAVLVYAATGHGPFDRLGEKPSAAVLLYRVVHEEPDLAGVPEELLPLVRACLAKRPEDRPTARAALELLPEPDRSAGRWATAQPTGLAADLAARAADMRAALGDPGTGLPSTAVLAGPDSAGLPAEAADATDAAAVSPSAGTTRPLPPTGTDTGAGTAYEHPAYRISPTPAPAPTPAPVPAPEPWPDPRETDGVRDAVPVPPPRPPHPAKHSARRVVPAVAGAVAVVVLAAVLVHTLTQHSDSDDAGANGGGSGGPTTSPASPSVDPDALPASWVGTWLGVGPGNPDGAYSMGLHTDSFKVTLTLRAGRIGQVVGQQVSDVHDQDTGRNDGCTESLQLTAVDAGTLDFTAKSPHPTDPASTLVCSPGNTYEVSMVGGTLRLAANSQGLGSPTTFTRKSSSSTPEPLSP